MIPFQKDIDEAQAALDLSNSELDIFTKESEEIKNRIKTAKSDLDELQVTIKEREQRKKQIMKEISSLQSDQKTKEAELQSLSGKDTQLMDVMSKAHAKAEEIRRTIQESQTQSKVLSKLMLLKNKGLPGIYGRLGNLGTIQQLDKYDIAVSTACGRLENIVVDTVETAQQCIDHLRDNQLGRLHIFILL